MTARQTMHNAFDPASLSEMPAELRSKIERRENVLGPGYRLFYRDPLEIVSGRGAHLFGPDGTDYLDAYNNVPSVGHCHPHVVEAVHRQMQTLNTNTRYVQDSLVSYAERLTATFPDELKEVTFTCSGSEANDLAVRLARRVTGNTGMIVTETAYHGLTIAVSEFSPSLGTASPLGEHVRTIPAPDRLRHIADGDLGAFLAEQVRAAAEDLKEHGYGVAAFIADSIFSSDGVFADPAGFLQPVVEAVHRAGGLYIADEVQPGFGRTGADWWGFRRHGIVPDIVTIGKPMGNGIPIAGAVFQPELTEEFGREVRYFNTFGGNSVSIAAGAAVMDVVETEDLIGNARKQGERLVDELRKITADQDDVLEVRGAGLFIGVDFVTDRESGRPDGARAAAVVNGMRERNVLISAAGKYGNVLKIRPPLVFDDADVDRFLEAFADATKS
ncbi:aspartate aminotransferase family protein [Saccharopolyspora karakumensis]|uniref:Aspartate aminotransferase family protein n=1 Tax=Saccharopolyspora karakumensis TaxID=2530386 RepID=A0A4R5BBM0_9PSEU|nr:aspartate aminotransferase family protein [Saccharopolyspora karakumensis]TDD83461.1 aspartate aminotransferase family protein [Saccharopolyspora karakumensis]